MTEEEVLWWPVDVDKIKAHGGNETESCGSTGKGLLQGGFSRQEVHRSD